MNKERLLESILFINNYNYNAIFERFPVLKTRLWAPQHGPAYLDIDIILKENEEYYDYRESCLSWHEDAPIYKINRYYYSHLQKVGVFDNQGQLKLTDEELQNIDKIEVRITMDTEPFCKVKLFTCSDSGIVDSVSTYEGDGKDYVYID